MDNTRADLQGQRILLLIILSVVFLLRWGFSAEDHLIECPIV